MEKIWSCDVRRRYDGREQKALTEEVEVHLNSNPQQFGSYSKRREQLPMTLPGSSAKPSEVTVEVDLGQQNRHVFGPGNQLLFVVPLFKSLNRMLRAFQRRAVLSEQHVNMMSFSQCIDICWNMDCAHSGSGRRLDV